MVGIFCFWAARALKATPLLLERLPVGLEDLTGLKVFFAGTTHFDSGQALSADRFSSELLKTKQKTPSFSFKPDPSLPERLPVGLEDLTGLKVFFAGTTLPNSGQALSADRFSSELLKTKRKNTKLQFQTGPFFTGTIAGRSRRPDRP